MKLKVKHSSEVAVLPSRESKYIEFKERMDVGRLEDWCEFLKDFVAIANSGGGELFVGVLNNGEPSDWDPSPLLKFDPAKIVDKVASYTGEQFAEFVVKKMQNGGKTICHISIGAAELPLVFVQPGTYEISPGKQKTAFGRGTVYFRHGAKSEPAVGKDLGQFIQRKVETIRRSWLGNIRKVVRAPAGYRVNLLPPEIIESARPDATPIRIVEDPRAPAYRKITPDFSHPNRRKEVVAKVNEQLGSRRKISPFDIECIKKVFRVDESKANWFYRSKFASPQYSDAFVDWIVAEYDADSEFFDKTRQNYHRMTQQRKS